jgi:iron(III) transport system ATP-binding protein
MPRLWSAEQLAVRYPGTDRWALRGVSLRLDSGSRLALVGTNGAGKSTLLKAIAGLLPIAAGDIRVFGQSVGGVSASAGVFAPAR